MPSSISSKRESSIRILLVALAWGFVLVAWGLGITPSAKHPLFAAATGFLACLCWLYLYPRQAAAIPRLLLSVTVTGLALAAVDIPLRPLADRRTFYREHERFVRVHDRYPQLLRYQPNVDFYSVTYGDLAAMSGDPALRETRAVRFQTDRYGFRNAGNAPDAPCDVVVLGDSCGVGNGVDQDKTWVGRLGSEHGYAVYNLSQVGNVYTHLLNFQLEAGRLRLQPDAVVLLAVFGGNDLEGEYGAKTNVAELPANTRWQTLRQHWLSFKRRSSIRRIFAAGPTEETSADNVLVVPAGPYRMAFYRPYLNMAGLSAGEVRTHRNTSRLLASLDALRESARGAGCRLAVVYLPSKAEVYSWLLPGRSGGPSPYEPSGLEQILQSHCAGAGIPYRDLGPALSAAAHALAAEDPPTFVWWRDDSHPNEAGNSVLADEGHSFLRELGVAARRVSPPPAADSRRGS